jgi:hypothetical protein
MKQTFYSLLIISLLLVSGNLSAQRDSSGQVSKKQPTALPKNPRVSSKPAYQPPKKSPSDSTATDTSSKYLKSKESLTQPINGGVMYLGLALGITRGQFAANTGDAIGYGFDVGALFNLAKNRTRAEWEKRWVNTYLGMHFMFLRNSSTSDGYSTNNGSYTTEIDAKVRNNMFQIGPISRVEFFPGPLKLFVEVGAGLSLFNGVHKIETTSIPNATHQPEEEKTASTSQTLRSNIIGYYNYAFGLRFASGEMGVEFKFSTLNGGTANYVDTKSVSFDRNTNKVSFSTHQSTTDLFIPTIALSGRF